MAQKQTDSSLTQVKYSYVNLKLISLTRVNTHQAKNPKKQNNNKITTEQMSFSTCFCNQPLQDFVQNLCCLFGFFFYLKLH